MIQQTDNLKLSAQKREAVGSRQSQQLRKSGWLPCIVYDSAGKSFAIGCKSECGFHHASKAGIVNLFSTPRDLFFKTAVPVARDYGNNLLIGCKSTRAFKVNEPCKEDQK